MASIRREISIDVSPAQAWSALRDVGALHTRLVVGFVTDCRMEGNTRVVTFANGVVAQEGIVDVNDSERRLVWSASGGRTGAAASCGLPISCPMTWRAGSPP